LGVYISILATLLALLTVNVKSVESGQSCLACHSSHYAERGSCTDCHRGNPLTDRKNIAHTRLIAGSYAKFTLGNVAVVKEGRRLMEQMACRRCHQISGNGNQLAVSLNTLLDQKQPAVVADSIKRPVSGMPDFRLDDNQVTAVVNAIFSGSRMEKRTQSERPMVMHFDRSASGEQDVFTRNCGSCHRVLTSRKGLIGTGNIGPNLSGLLTRYYPPSFRTHEYWSVSALQSWLKNPRQVKPDALMKPVKLNLKQLNELSELLI
jgi:mono/diheme cytochrome c family protein